MSNTNFSLGDVNQSVETRTVKGWRKIFSFFGPAYLISVGYMDPGNWATGIAGGSGYGYSLIWVLLMSNLMALFLQGLSARLGIVRGLDLAQANRETYPRIVNWFQFGLAEIAIAATDLAEVLGMAIGLNLLTGLPVIWGVILTAFDTLLLLWLQRYGIKKMEAFIIALVSIISISFIIELFIAHPDLGAVAGGLVPALKDDQALYIAIGIIGATVMPHNLYLHSSLVQTRKIERSVKGIRDAIRFNFFDSAIALNMALFVNAAILILSATAFFTTGNTHVVEIEEAHKLLEPILGSKLAPLLFAIALIAAGQSSTVTGTLAGQIVMEGYLHLRISPVLRRLITRMLAIIPAVLVILIAGEEQVGGLLIFSQVVLSLQLGFAVIPLIHFVSDKRKMGVFAISTIKKIIAWAIAILVVILNIRMVINEITDISENIWTDIIWTLVGSLTLLLLAITLIYPMISKRKETDFELKVHPERTSLGNLSLPPINKIAMALDFSDQDENVIKYALAQGSSDTKYLLIHVVESASSRMWGVESNDLEVRKDQQQIDTYIKLLQDKGYDVIGKLGFQNRAKDIARLATEFGADLLVVGGHGHKGIKDWIYGETINDVRHKLNIPVLVV